SQRFFLAINRTLQWRSARKAAADDIRGCRSQALAVRADGKDLAHRTSGRDCQNRAGNSSRIAEDVLGILLSASTFMRWTANCDWRMRRRLDLDVWLCLARGFQRSAEISSRDYAPCARGN